MVKPPEMVASPLRCTELLAGPEICWNNTIVAAATVVTVPPATPTLNTMDGEEE